MQVHPGEGLLRALAEQARRRTRALSPRVLGVLCWALARFGALSARDAELLEGAADALVERYGGGGRGNSSGRAASGASEAEEGGGGDGGGSTNMSVLDLGKSGLGSGGGGGAARPAAVDLPAAAAAEPGGSGAAAQPTAAAAAASSPWLPPGEAAPDAAAPTLASTLAKPVRKVLAPAAPAPASAARQAGEAAATPPPSSATGAASAQAAADPPSSSSLSRRPPAWQPDSAGHAPDPDQALDPDVLVGMALSLTKAKVFHPALLQLATRSLLTTANRCQLPPGRAGRTAQLACCLLWSLASTPGLQTPADDLHALFQQAAAVLSPSPSPGVMEPTARGRPRRSQPAPAADAAAGVPPGLVLGALANPGAYPCAIAPQLALASRLAAAAPSRPTLAVSLGLPEVRLLAMLLQALPPLHYQPGPGFMDGACAALAAGGAARGLSTHTLCEVLWALVAMQVSPGSGLHEVDVLAPACAPSYARERFAC